MKLAVFFGFCGVLTALVGAFWWVKGQPFDWDAFYDRGNWGSRVMTNPGQPLKKDP